METFEHVVVEYSSYGLKGRYLTVDNGVFRYSSDRRV